jgi:hypothetical protein
MFCALFLRIAPPLWPVAPDCIVAQAALMAQDRNFKAARAELAKIDGSGIPFFGMYLTDMVMLDGSNPDFIAVEPNTSEGGGDGDEDEHGGDGGGDDEAGSAGQGESESGSTRGGLIHFGKRRLVAKVILEVQRLQARPYSFSPHYELREFFLDFPGLNDVTDTDDITGTTSGGGGRTIDFPPPGAAKADLEKFDEAVYQQSLAIEPRAAKGDKHALPFGLKLFDSRAQQKRRAVVATMAAKGGRRPTAPSTSRHHPAVQHTNYPQAQSTESLSAAPTASARASGRSTWAAAQGRPSATGRHVGSVDAVPISDDGSVRGSGSSERGGSGFPLSAGLSSVTLSADANSDTAV